MTHRIIENLSAISKRNISYIPNTKTIIILILVGTIIISASSNNLAFACLCGKSPLPEDAFKESTAVFSGKVIEISRDPSSYSITAKFDVERTWKGISDKMISVSTGSDNGNCGYGFVVGETYMVYAVGEDSLYTSQCGRTRLFVDTYEDLHVLGTGKVIQTQTDDTTKPNTMSVPSWIKKTAGEWAGSQAEDKDFVQGIQYLIQKGIMKMPETKSSDSSQKIPTWIKNNARWWADGEISDNDFVSGIQYLISKGIMKVGPSPIVSKKETGGY
jgi:hypothetical protein